MSRPGSRGCAHGACDTTFVIPSERSESRDLHFAVQISLRRGFTRSTRRIAEDAENGARGRAARTAAPLLSIHGFKIIGAPVERSLHPTEPSGRVRANPGDPEIKRVRLVERFNESDPLDPLDRSTSLTP
jgi:hypothetical protein